MNAKPNAIECPNCGCRHLEVVATRKTKSGKVRRTRKCRHCDRRVWTREQPEEATASAPPPPKRGSLLD